MRVSGVEETSNRRVIKMKSNRTVSQMKDSSPIDDRMLDAMIGQARPRIARAMKILRRPQARVGVIPSPLGKLLVAESDRGLAAVHFFFLSVGDRTPTPLRLKFYLIPIN